jgi:hypothetical protein
MFLFQTVTISVLFEEQAAFHKVSDSSPNVFMGMGTPGFGGEGVERGSGREGGSQKNLFTSLHLSHLILHLLTSLEYSG